MGSGLGQRGVTPCSNREHRVDWKPICNVMEDELTIWVVNARRIKAVPGRRTDVKTPSAWR